MIARFTEPEVTHATVARSESNPNIRDVHGNRQM
ncbi:MAG: hypothetical protein ACJA07_001015 [Rhodococcus sp. (in: high G+C Gram-positive bacteria)]|jgi:hypothetical protein